MSIPGIVAFVVVLFAALLVTAPLGRVLRVPHSVLLILAGAAGAYVATQVIGIDLGLRAMGFHDLVFYVFLPVLIFDAAYHLPIAALRRDLAPILFLAVIGVLATSGITGVIVFYAIGVPDHFPWPVALLTGALLAATDPVAVIAQLKALRAPERLATLMEGESLLNDATAILIFGIMLSIATVSGEGVSFGAALGDLLMALLGGTAVGVAASFAAMAMLKGSTGQTDHSLVLFTAAYGSYLGAEFLFQVSGIVATLCTGLLLARHVQRSSGQTARSAVASTFSFLAYTANGSVFLLAGVTLTLAMFTDRWLAMLIAIAAALIARAVVVFGGIPATNWMSREPIRFDEQLIVVWGGLRGAVTLALTLALPTTVESWWTIQSMAYGVVLFSLFVQAPTMPWLIRRL